MDFSFQLLLFFNFTAMNHIETWSLTDTCSPSLCTLLVIGVIGYMVVQCSFNA